jgi:hypothetical protein
MTTFYCLRFETPPTWRARSPYLYPPRNKVARLYPQALGLHTLNSFQDKVILRQSVSLGVEPHVGLMTRYLLLFDSYGPFLWGALSDERTGLFFFCICCCPSPAQSFSGPSPFGLETIFYCLSFETSLPLLRLAGSRWRCSTQPPHWS